jgi:hypothetical protein
MAFVLQRDRALLTDANGVAMYNYGGDIGIVYNPKVVATVGLEYYDNGEKGNKKAKRYFLNTADWLVTNLKNKSNYSIWEYDFPWKHYGGISPPYSSGLAQAVGANLLIKAYNSTADSRYSSAAKAAFNALLIDYDTGGVCSIEKDGSIFLQILAKPDLEKTYVLNGHTAALMHVWHCYLQSHDTEARLLFQRGINWLSNNLQRYDTGSWSSYDLMGTPAASNYHQSHIVQLSQLYNIIGEAILKYYSEKFAAYENKSSA